MTHLLTNFQDQSRRTKLLVAGGTLLLVAACGGGAGLLTGIDSLGADFVAAFNAGPNTDPVDPSGFALVVDPTIDPFNP